MARARLMTSGLYIIVWNGPDSETLRAAWNSSAAFFCSASYCAGGILGRRCCAPAGPARKRVLAIRIVARRNMGGLPGRCSVLEWPAGCDLIDRGPTTSFVAHESSRTSVSSGLRLVLAASVRAERVSGAPKWNEPARAAAGVAAGQRRAGRLFDGARRIVLRGRAAARADPRADRPDLRHRRLPAAVSSRRAARRHRAPGRHAGRAQLRPRRQRLVALLGLQRPGGAPGHAGQSRARWR